MGENVLSPHSRGVTPTETDLFSKASTGPLNREKAERLPETVVVVVVVG